MTQDIVERLRAAAVADRALFHTADAERNEEAAAEIETLHARMAEREGWQLVPVEATEEMAIAAISASHTRHRRSLKTGTSITLIDAMKENFREMLAASPPAPAQEGG